MNTKIYVIDNGFTNEGCIFYQMDPITFGLSKRGPILNENWTVNGLTSSGGNVYGWASKSGEKGISLLSINTTTGKGTVTATIGNNPVEALTMDEHGIVYSIIKDESPSLKFTKFNPKSDEYTIIGSLFPSIKSVGALTFDSIGNLYALINVKNNEAPNNNGTYLSSVNLSTGEVNIGGTGMKFLDNTHAKNINSMAYCGFKLYGGSGISNIYDIQGPLGIVSAMGQPNSLGSFLLNGMTSCI